MLTSVRWGTILIGVASGLFAMVVAGLVVFVFVILAGAGSDDLGGLIALTVALFAGQFFAGYVAGRLNSSRGHAFHGSLAGLGLYGVVATLGLAQGSPAAALTLFFFAMVAMVIGMAGGVLAARPRDDDDDTGAGDPVGGTPSDS